MSKRISELRYVGQIGCIKLGAFDTDEASNGCGWAYEGMELSQYVPLQLKTKKPCNSRALQTRLRTQGIEIDNYRPIGPSSH